MKKISLGKKFLSSVMFGLLVLGGSFGAAQVASAKFLILGSHGLVTGVITDYNKQNMTFTIDTDGTTPTVIKATNDTKLIGADKYSDFSIGDKVDVRGYQQDGVKYATSIRKLSQNGYGYGNGGKTVLLGNAVVTAKSSTAFTVRDGFNPIIFNIDSNTNFVGKSYAQLHTDDHVRVIGTDMGTGFYAKTVVFVQNDNNNNE